MNRIPLEVIGIVGKYLTFCEFQIVNNVFNLDLTNKYMFANSVLFDNQNKISKSLMSYEINNGNELYDILFQSAYNILQLYDILYAIENNTITCNNKYNYNININLSKKSTMHINNTITITKIIFATIEPYIFQSDMIINNPYYYTSINITDCLIQYFQIIIRDNYIIKKSIRANSTKFKMMMFDSIWYRYNIRIFDIYMIYLLNIDVISKIHTNEIYKISNEFLEHNFNRKNNNQKFKKNLLTLFHGSIHLPQLDKILNIN